MDCAPTPEPAVDDAWQRPLLRDLAELGMALAREVQHQALRQAAADTTTSDEPQAGLLFTRIARAIRQTVALDANLAARNRPGQTGSAAEQARHAATAGRRRHLARREVRRHLEHAIHADERTRGDCERLLADLDDRLDDDDIDTLLATTSIAEIVLALCNEFAIKPDFSQWNDEELVKLVGDTEPEHADPPHALA